MSPTEQEFILNLTSDNSGSNRRYGTGAPVNKAVVYQKLAEWCIKSCGEKAGAGNTASSSAFSPGYSNTGGANNGHYTTPPVAYAGGMAAFTNAQHYTVTATFPGYPKVPHAQVSPSEFVATAMASK